MNAILRRLIHPEIRVLDEKAGIVEYVASDETLDSYNEVILAAGWRFDEFKKNSPFLDSHDYSSIDNCLGKVLDFQVTGKRLIETVKWAIDVPQNFAAIKGFAMTVGKYLTAVSVGFTTEKYCTKWDNDKTAWQQALKELGMHEEDGVCCVYLEQQQKELSACVIGANPNAVARAYKAGILSDEDIQKFSSMVAQSKTANLTDGAAAVELARQRRQTAFLVELQTNLNHI